MEKIYTKIIDCKIKNKNGQKYEGKCKAEIITKNNTIDEIKLKPLKYNKTLLLGYDHFVDIKINIDDNNHEEYECYIINPINFYFNIMKKIKGF